MKTSKVIKVVVAVILWGIYSQIYNIYYPVMTVAMSKHQMDISAESFTDFAAYQQFWNYAWLIPTVIILLMFLKDIKWLITKIKNYIKENY